MRHGAKFGRELVSAISDPHPGMIISGTNRADGPNQWVDLAAEDRPIEGVVLKAGASNAGTIYVTGAEGNVDGFPLAAGETLSIMTDRLSRVKVWVPTTADEFSWLAIEQARD